MSHTYTAILSPDGIRWIGDPPAAVASGATVIADVRVRDVQALPPAKGTGRDLVARLDRIAEAGTFDEMSDPVEWQRESRQDRPLL